MKRIEAVADAVAAHNDYYSPESPAYELRNPGLVNGPDGRRRFSCHKAGYASLIDKIQKYCVTHPEDTLDSLLEYLDIRMKLQKQRALDFTSRCANVGVLKLDMKISFFLLD